MDKPIREPTDKERDDGREGNYLNAYTYGDPVPRRVGSPMIHWSIGIPGSGKTFLAYAYAKENAQVNHNPILVVNSADTRDFDDIPRVPDKRDNLRTMVEWVWRDKKSCQIVPHDAVEFERIVNCAIEPGGIELVVDETHYWLSARGGSINSPLVKLCRAFRHGGTSVFFTTQHFSGDVPQEMISCAPEIYLFRSTSPAVLDRLENNYELDRNAVKTLPARRFFFLYEGFSLESSQPHENIPVK